MSQKALAEKAGGITWQQLQKYEKGTNRVSASRLSEIATALKVPITYFFPDPGVDFAAQTDFSAMVATRAGREVLRHFAKLSRPWQVNVMNIVVQARADQFQEGE